MQLAHKNIDLKIYSEEDINTYKISVEPVSFQNTILNNLISNAIKFSYPNSEILIKVNRLDEDNDKEKISISIIDHGTGISQNKINSIFSSSERTSSIGTNGEKGTGFGLPLVQKFVLKSNGKIFVKTKSIDQYKDDHGTEFRLEFFQNKNNT